jgi:aminomethyltransferase
MALRRTPFFSFHQEHGARLIDFGGWEMPVQYAGILQEHAAVRTAVGLFDVSHMGEVWVRGPKALDAIRHLVTNDVQIAAGKAQYSPVCRPDGGIVDDVIVYVMGPEEALICVNASNRDKDFAWFVANNPFPEEAVFTDESDQWAQVAIQGRHAPATLAALTSADLNSVAYYGHVRGTVAGVDGCIIARTGYTGEDGFEVFLPVDGAAQLWPAIVDAGTSHGLQPIGLGARDTLRLEARMCLYGNDISDTTTPLEAQIGWAVKLNKPDFIGRSALIAQREAGVPRRLVGLQVADRIARHGNGVLSEGTLVGEVTSGTKSPTLGTNIAMAYVPSALSNPGTSLTIDVRGKTAAATVVKGPFYKRDY